MRFHNEFRPFPDLGAEFEIVKEERQVGHGGATALVSTGEGRCLGTCDDGEVYSQIAVAPEYIPHLDGCDQADVISEFSAGSH